MTCDARTLPCPPTPVTIMFNTLAVKVSPSFNLDCPLRAQVHTDLTAIADEFINKCLPFLWIPDCSWTRERSAAKAVAAAVIPDTLVLMNINPRTSRSFGCHQCTGLTKHQDFHTFCLKELIHGFSCPFDIVGIMNHYWEIEPLNNVFYVNPFYNFTHGVLAHPRMGLMSSHSRSLIV